MDAGELALGGLVAEVKADLRLLTLGFSSEMKVGLDDDVTVGGQMVCEALWKREGTGSGDPAANAAPGTFANGHFGEAGFGVGGIDFTGAALGIDGEKGVMDDLPAGKLVGRTKFR